MTQNIYDNPEFFTRYSRLERSRIGLAGMDEWPAIRALLPSLKNKSILDLGCGYGAFCRWAVSEGAAGVLGVDVSEKMLERARMDPEHGITYRLGDLEALALPEMEFDVAFSSLVLHYIENLEKLLTTVLRALKHGGKFVFSVDHPIYLSSRRSEWHTDKNGRRSWPIDSYLIEGVRDTLWLVPGVVKYHRMTGTMINLLLRSGFNLSHVEEWRPSDEQIAKRPGLALELERPRFLMISAVRP